MASVKAFVFFLSFFLVFDTLVGLWAVGSTDYSGLSLPALPETPTLINYIELAGGYIALFFGVAVITITNVPIWLSFLTVTMNAGFVFVLIQMIRGN
jgi:hypothetical protein